MARGRAGCRQGTRPGPPDGRSRRTTAEMDDAVAAIFREHQATPLVPGLSQLGQGKAAVSRPSSVPASTSRSCTASPTAVRFREGDIVSIDTGCKVNGWCGDAAVTLAIGAQARDPEAPRRDLRDAQPVDPCHGPLRTGLEVASLMERYVKSQGMYVIEKFVGHGIGQDMHEEPQVPNFVSKVAAQARHQARAGHRAGDRAHGRPGDQGSAHPGRRLDRRDQGSPRQRHFEHTVAMTPEGPRVLTYLED